MSTTKQYDCYTVELPRTVPLLQPWPCCGLSSKPRTISGTVTYSHTGGGVTNCPMADGTYSVTWTLSNDCTFVYYNVAHPIAIAFTYPCWAISRYASPQVGLFGYSTNFQADSQNAGSCSYSNGWTYTGSFTGHFDLDVRRCTMQVNITGVG